MDVGKGVSGFVRQKDFPLRRIVLLFLKCTLWSWPNCCIIQNVVLVVGWACLHTSVHSLDS